MGRLQRYDRRSSRRLHLLVHAGIHTGKRQFQLAHAHRVIQVSRLWRISNTNTNADADSNSNSNSNTNADSNSNTNANTNPNPNTYSNTDAGAQRSE